MNWYKTAQSYDAVWHFGDLPTQGVFWFVSPNADPDVNIPFRITEIEVSNGKLEPRGHDYLRKASDADVIEYLSKIGFSIEQIKKSTRQTFRNTTGIAV